MSYLTLKIPEGISSTQSTEIGLFNRDFGWRYDVETTTTYPGWTFSHDPGVFKTPLLRAAAIQGPATFTWKFTFTPYGVYSQNQSAYANLKLDGVPSGGGPIDIQ